MPLRKIFHKNPLKDSREHMKKQIITEGRIYFPLSETLKLVIENIMKRLTRALLTMSGIVLSIAFYTTLMLTASVLKYTLGAQQVISEYYWWMLFLAFLVSATGITNSVLMAVAERVREIGTLKCLGAMDKHILEMFILENAFIGAIGGVVGFIVGIVAAIVLNASTIGISSFFAIPGIEFLKALLSSILISTILSVVMSSYPAYRAAKLQPAEALRSVA
ncbi:MAG: hypothetical protein DRN81_00040 [Thermoproteota archaeon]|nr:MAG: hypothetical protein DRN81_00040 [Candidatus Korarchaeota archaeon]